jgi:hypothetical protein
MLISGREARALLQGAGFSSRHARTALDCGLAGEPVRAKAAHLYDEARVHELAGRPTVEWRAVLEGCPEGIFVARRELDLTRSTPELVAQASRGWGEMNPFQWWAMCAHIHKHGSLPFVATVASVVVLGADVVGGLAGSELRLAEPGAWFDRFRGGRLVSGPGRPWVVFLG